MGTDWSFWGCLLTIGFLSIVILACLIASGKYASSVSQIINKSKDTIKHGRYYIYYYCTLLYPRMVELYLIIFVAFKKSLSFFFGNETIKYHAKDLASNLPMPIDIKQKNGSSQICMSTSDISKETTEHIDAQAKNDMNKSVDIPCVKKKGNKKPQKSMELEKQAQYSPKDLNTVKVDPVHKSLDTKIISSPPPGFERVNTTISSITGQASGFSNAGTKILLDDQVVPIERFLPTGTPKQPQRHPLNESSKSRWSPFSSGFHVIIPPPQEAPNSRPSSPCLSADEDHLPFIRSESTLNEHSEAFKHTSIESIASHEYQASQNWRQRQKHQVGSSGNFSGFNH
jgi:hypothetical protein